MTSASVEKWVNSSLSSITNAKFKDCIKVSNVEIAPLTDQIVVVVSDIYRVKMTLEYKNGDKAELKAVYKMEPLTKQAFGQMAMQAGLSDREFMVYDKVLRLTETLISANEETKELLWPECYLCTNKRFLLQDLCEDGYRIVTTAELPQMLSVGHAKLAIQAIGKYHAMSLALKDQGMLEPDKLPDNFLITGSVFINNLYSGGLRQLADVIDKEWPQEWKPVSDKLRKAVENIGEKLKDLMHSTAGKCSVLVHGDFTMRNMLFQYDKQCQNTPVNIKLIDFQGASWSNLALDLATLLNSSVLPQTREDNLDEMLNAYSDSLQHWCSKFGYKGEPITSSDVRRAYESFGYWSMLVSLFAVPAFHVPKDKSSIDTFLKGKLEEILKHPLNSACFKDKQVDDAIKYQIKLSLKQNIL